MIQGVQGKNEAESKSKMGFLFGGAPGRKDLVEKQP
jgi:hypothetical protein